MTASPREPATSGEPRGRQHEKSRAPRGERDAPAKKDAAEQAKREEETLRERWEATQESFRERFEGPINRATEITEKTLAWFPVRVWRHFLQTNGFLLSAGISYQALFAFFAAIYLVFAIAGLWLGGSPEAVKALIDVVNSYIPGFIAEGGIITPEQVQQVTDESTGVLGVTGLIALGTVIWTAIGFVTYARRGVRDIFELPYDHRSYFLLKARDLVAALIFGIALVLGAGLSTLASWTLDFVFGLFGWEESTGAVASLRIGSVVISMVINSVALASLFRFLTGATLKWRRIWPGSLLGGGALTVLLIGAGFLLGYTPSNPLLATFAIFVGLLLWFKIMGIVLLVAAAWIAIASKDRNIALLEPSEAERLAAEHHALLVAAQVRLRTAQESRAHTPWYNIWAADRAVRQAARELEEVEASGPPSTPSHHAAATNARPKKSVGHSD